MNVMVKTIVITMLRVQTLLVLITVPVMMGLKEMVPVVKVKLEQKPWSFKIPTVKEIPL